MERDVRDVLARVAEAVDQDDRARTADELEAVIGELGDMLPTTWIEHTIEALHSNNFDLLSDGFIRTEFLGPSGYFLLVGPYTGLDRRTMASTYRFSLSMMFGRVIEFPNHPEVKAELLKIQGQPLRQDVPEIRPFQRLRAAGSCRFS